MAGHPLEHAATRGARYAPEPIAVLSIEDGVAEVDFNGHLFPHATRKAAVIQMVRLVAAWREAHGRSDPMRGICMLKRLPDGRGRVFTQSGPRGEPLPHGDAFRAAARAMWLTEEEVEARTRRDLEGVLGRVSLARSVQCYDDSGSSEEVCFDPPIPVRVTGGSTDRWMDDDNCDPVWNVEVLEARPELKGMRPAWMYGTSRSRGGIVGPSELEPAPADLVERLRDAPGLSEEEIQSAIGDGASAPRR